jgi:hypothetical protein
MLAKNLRKLEMAEKGKSRLDALGGGGRPIKT